MTNDIIADEDRFDLAVLRDTIAVVTGAGNGGIGWGIAKHAASLGMHVVVMDLHDSLVQQAETELKALYPSVQSLGIDRGHQYHQNVRACSPAAELTVYF